MQNIFNSKIKFGFSILLICLPMFLYAQVNWVVKKPFEQKNFVENKGQFEVKGKLKSNEILYEAHIDGVRYYFTKKGYLVEHTVRKLKKSEPNGEKDANVREEEKKKYTLVGEYHELLWEGSNPNVVVETEDKVNNYYTCSDTKNTIPNATFKSSAYKKLIYKNMYPNIDVVFEFMKDTVGIKYSLLVHYGADLSKVKMVYPISKGVSMDKNGNVSIVSPMGVITDHKPYTYLQSSKKELKSSFILKNKKVSFKVGNIHPLRPTDVIVIDPWTTNPSFTGVNKGYDVDYDKYGNVYVYGGGGNLLQLNKYTSAGVLVWTYNSFQNGAGYYGDFAIDISSGSIYLVEGFNFMSGANAVKLNPAGVQTAIFTGNSQFAEMWRIAFSRCTNNAVIAGGGTSSPTYQTCYLDTNLVNITPKQYIITNNCCHDVNCLALDNYGFCYQITNESSVGDGLYANALIKLPMPALTPDIYNVSTNYAWVEAGSNIFSIGASNGYNGIATSNTNVYTYDGYALKKWKGANGAQLIYKRINFPAGGDSTQIYWGGLAADECDHLFIGDQDTIKQYDSSLVFVSSYKMNGDIYDVKLGNNGNLYSCGDGFVAQIQVLLPPCNSSGLDATITSQDVGCSSLGSASIVVSGGTPPYSITWNTNPPQTGAAIYNLEAGTYVVTVIDSSCIQHTRTDTVVINSTSFSSQTTTKNVSCPAVADGAALIDNTGGTAPYTYKWSNGQSGTNLNSISGLAPGSYTVEITDNAGCKSTVKFVIDTAGSVPNFALLATNIFTPNGDNVNDIYFPFDKTQSAITVFASEYSLVIFNRWGNKVFETTDAKIGWDGKMPNGKDASPGVYFWMMDVTINCAKEPNTSMKGFLHLDR